MPSAQETDFSSPFFAAKLIVGGANGPAYPIWTTAASGQPFSSNDDHLNGLKALSFATELVVDLNLSGIPQIRLTLSPPYEDAIKFLDSDLAEFGSNYLQVQFGYAKGGPGGGPNLSPVYEGLTKSPEVTLGVNCQIVIPAIGVGGVASAGDLGAGKTYIDTRRKAIDEICQRCGMVSDYKAADNDPEVKKILDAPLNWTQAWRTDMFMLQILTRQSHCYFRIVKSNANNQGVVEVIARSSFWAKTTPKHTLAMFHLSPTGVGSLDFPLLSAATPAKALWLPGVRKAILHEIDEKTRQATKAEVTHDTLKDASSSAGPADVSAKSNNLMQDLDANGQGKGNVAVIQIPGDPARPDYIEALHASFTQFRASGMGIPLDFECLGIPTLMPGEAVKVRGLGMKLDRIENYGVFKTTHILNSSGYMMTGHMVANTAAQLDSKLADLASGSFPTETTGPAPGTVTANPQGVTPGSSARSQTTGA